MVKNTKLNLSDLVGGANELIFLMLTVLGTIPLASELSTATLIFFLHQFYLCFKLKAIVASLFWAIDPSGYVKFSIIRLEPFPLLEATFTKNLVESS